jgi:hypothetical protein
MIQCSIHGLTDIGQACRHVGIARDTGNLESTHVARDAFAVAVLICSHCLARYGLKVSDMKDEDGPVAVCFDCLIDWHAKTGQGDLLSRYKQSQ